MTQHSGPTLDDIKLAANARPNDVLAWCGIRESFGHKNYISMCNPMRKDRSPSFTIWFKGGTLSFRDESDPAGTCGDVFGFVAYMNGWYDAPKKGLRPTCRFLTAKLGLADVPSEQLARDRAAGRVREKQILKQSEEDQARNEGRAMALWLNASPIFNSVADEYLRRARGIDLSALPLGPRGGSRVPSVLRCIPLQMHAESKREFPCMIAGCVDYALAEPRIRAVHRTWLKADGSGKADVRPARKVWPGFAGLVIPIWTGSSGLSIRHAAENGLRETLVLTEGIEDGLTAVLANPEHRVWAVIALGNLGNVPVPECIDGIIVHRQNDWQKPQAVEAFERAKAALEATGRPVAEVRASHGKDLNDTLRGGD